MFIPEGHTEETVMKALQKVLNQLCMAFRFGYYDEEDMRQEGYMFGLDVLDKYKPDMSSLETFLHHHIRNQFINLRRNKLERKSPPCLTCAFYDSTNEDNPCTAFDEQNKCNRWRGWLFRNQTKRNLVETSIYNEEENEDVSRNCLDKLVTKETLEAIDLHMPLELRGDYRRLIDGATVPKNRRDKIYEAAKNILREFNNEQI